MPSWKERFAGGTALLTKLSDNAQKIDDLRDEKNLLEFQQQALDLQRILYEAEQEIFRLNQEVDELKDKMRHTDSLEFDEKLGVYRKDGDPLSYCANCFHTNGSLVPLQVSSGIKCTVCGKVFKNPPAMVAFSR